jgi:hypothetical protein
MPGTLGRVSDSVTRQLATTVASRSMVKIKASNPNSLGVTFFQRYTTTLLTRWDKYSHVKTNASLQSSS